MTSALIDTAATTVVRRQDYSVPGYWIKTVHLTFDLDPLKTLVINVMQMQRNSAAPKQSLKLHGEELNLTRVLVDGESVSFKHEAGMLVIDNLPTEPFSLEIRSTCAPSKNTDLMGLYTSQGGFFTQCEAQGFRRMTYFLDQPDVMAIYTVTVRAPRAAYPVLLSNGNLVEEGALPSGRHFATWHDPFPKPSYLFALVAADLVAQEQRIRTRSGKNHLLQIFVRRGDLDKTQYAMQSLIASIIWDEARFNLPLDLERFMVVAVGDFNMGAMENKGLNIFNTKYVLASPHTATDSDYAGIESVIGHEYFHNWSGNRVTCRDWFQLSLKEGLTVFRDQEFSMDMAGSASARAVKRISDVRHLRWLQFSEDAGSMAHPVRPDSYREINNFYTSTVYEKGAEVVRMMQTLVGKNGFAQGMALYFERHDGQAVTCDDFAQAMADANPESALHTHLAQFKHWYGQAGTPHLRAKGRYDAPSRTYTLVLEQSSLPSPGQPTKLPFVLPVAMALIGRDGRAVPLQLERQAQSCGLEQVLVLTEKRNFYTFINVDVDPVPSLLRGFSAPVKLTDTLTDADLLLLLEHDTDPFNRWEAGQRLGLNRMLSAIEADIPLVLDEAFTNAMRSVLRHPELDAAFKAEALCMPSEIDLAQHLSPVDPKHIHAVSQAMTQQLASALYVDWQWAFEHHTVTGSNSRYSPDAVSAGKRALTSMALFMLCEHAAQLGDPLWPGIALQRCKDADNMTDRLGALDALLSTHSPLAGAALAHFHHQFKDEPLALDKWFALQAGAPEAGGKVFAQVQQLLKHPDFALSNPNRARSLISTLCTANPGAFHRTDGAGYTFWLDCIKALDAINPHLAARMSRALDSWSNLAEPYRSAALAALRQLAAHSSLSSNVREIIDCALRVCDEAVALDSVAETEWFLKG
jgi:aminopeptidase N